MIKLEHVNFKYDTIDNAGINDVSLHIRRGECVVLYGASGCGKTTLLRLMSGLAPGQYEGELEGHVVKEWTASEFESISIDEAKKYRLRHPKLVEEFAKLSHDNGKGDFTYKIEQLSFCYKKSENGFANISAEISGGKVTAIIGENGAGKTTLSKVLCGFLYLEFTM